MSSYHSYQYPSSSQETWGNGFSGPQIPSKNPTDQVFRYKNYDHEMSGQHNARYAHSQKSLRRQSPPVVHRPKQTWPPNPTVEDELTSLSHEYDPQLADAGEMEVPHRGDIDQEKIMLAVNQFSPEFSASTRKTSQGYLINSSWSSFSNESSIFLTPGSEDRNRDRRYVYLPEKGIEIPLTYDEPRTPKYEMKPHPVKQDSHRGRSQKPKLETESPKRQSSEIPEPRPHLERLPSPYSYTPKANNRMETLSGDYMLSPDVMSPRAKPAEKQSPYFQDVSQPTKDKENRTRSQTSTVAEARTQSSTNRHKSTDAQSTERIGRTGKSASLQSTPYPMSDDEPDVSSDELPGSGGVIGSNQLSPESPRLLNMPRIEDFTRPKEGNKRPLEQPMLPPRQTLIATDAPSAGYTAMGFEYVNAQLPSPQSDQRKASPRGSPMDGPHSMPPVTPPDDRYHYYSAGRAASPRNTPPTSRPSSRTPSPMRIPHSRQTTGLSPSTPNQPESTQSIPRARSRMTSPLPSPGLQAAGTAVAPRIDVRAPSPANQNRLTSSNANNIRKSTSTRISLAPLELPGPPKLATPSVGRRRRAVSNTETRPQLSVDSSWTQQGTESARTPRARSRPSTLKRAVSFGTEPSTLPPCLRPVPVTGFTDWYTLVGCPSFSICPSCRDAVASTGHGRHFTPSLSRSSGVETRCDFSVPWVRMAWLLTGKNRRLDVDMIYAMAEIAAQEPPCPGRIGAVRQWYRVVDAENMKQFPSFDACPYCVRNLETLFPVLRGVFQKSRSHRPTQERSCDLRSDSKRFPTYIDHLELTANQASEFRRSPNTFRFIELAKRMSSIRECSRDDMLLDQRWHIMTQIPELTVCEECYDEVVRPAINSGSTLATQFSRNAHRVAPPGVGVSCQLYSPRVRSAFAEACRRNDLAGLKAMAVKRYQVERDLQARSAAVQKADIEEEERAEWVKELVNDWKRWE